MFYFNLFSSEIQKIWSRFSKSNHLLFYTNKGYTVFEFLCVVVLASVPLSGEEPKKKECPVTTKCAVLGSFKWLSLCGDAPLINEKMDHALDESKTRFKRAFWLLMHFLDATGRNFGQVSPQFQQKISTNHLFYSVNDFFSMFLVQKNILKFVIFNNFSPFLEIFNWIGNENCIFMCTGVFRQQPDLWLPDPGWSGRRRTPGRPLRLCRLHCRPSLRPGEYHFLFLYSSTFACVEVP